MDPSHDNSQSEGQVGDSSSSLLDMSNSKTFWADSSMSEEEKIWHLAKKIGVNGNDNDQFFIEKIKRLEARDKDAKKKMVNLNGSL